MDQLWNCNCSPDCSAKKKYTFYFFGSHSSLRTILKNNNNNNNNKNFEKKYVNFVLFMYVNHDLSWLFTW